MEEVSLDKIFDARETLQGYVTRTPVLHSVSLSERAGAPVHLKAEHHQVTGAFKLRGATNAVRRLEPGERARGVVTATTGNHGRALAFAAKQAGVRATICMSELVPENKVAAIRALGCDVQIIGRSQDAAMQRVRELVGEGQVDIPPFDHPDVIAGQGTIGLEILEDVPDVDTILIPLSGGGLASGVAKAVKELRPAAKVIGISMRKGAAMAVSLQAGHPVEVVEEKTLADSLGGGIGLNNRYTFSMVRDLVDEVILLDESEIAQGIAHAYWHEGDVIEGAGGIGIAAILAQKVVAKGPIVALMSGKNIDRDQHLEVISQYRVC